MSDLNSSNPIWEAGATDGATTRTTPFLTALAAALILSTLTALGAFSYARLIFSGSLSEYASIGFFSAMVSALLVGLFVARGSSLPGIVAIPQDRVAPILALMAVEMVRDLEGAVPARTAALTVLLAVAIATATTGVVLLVLGKLRLGNLLRFIPYPVVGGFLAASGWLLVRGGLQILTGGLPGSEFLSWFDSARAGAPAMWPLGLGLAFAIAVLNRRKLHALLLPCSLLITFVGFYAWLAWNGTAVEQARALGLLAPVLATPWGIGIGLEDFAQVPIAVVINQTDLIGTILITAFISILLSSSAIELATNHEADLNRELRSAGWGNLLAGGCGGMVGFHSLSMSHLALSLGVRDRRAATWSAVACGLLLLAGPFLLGYVPNLVLGVLLMALGMGLLLEWIVDGWNRLSKTDYAIVSLILATVAVLGYLEGVAVGTVAAVVLFIIKYSQVSVINTIADSRRVRSNVERPAWQLELLDRDGERVLMIRLRGFVFFGTAAEIIAAIRGRVRDPGRMTLLAVVIDFQGVTGCDSSAAVALVRVHQLARTERFELFLAGLSERVERDLFRAGLTPAISRSRVLPDLDHALEAAEDTLIARVEGGADAASLNLAEQLRRSWPEPSQVDQLMHHLERFEFKAGDHLIRQGEAADAIYFVESGHVTARIENGNGRSIRLRRQGAGTMVGELGYYLNAKRSASVVADTAGVAFRFSRTALAEISRVDPALESSFHQFVVRVLAARNAFINASLQQGSGLGSQ